MTTTLLASFPSPARGVWHLGPLPIRAYALCIIVGIVVALLIGDRRWRARGGEPGVIYDIAVWAVPFGLIGGRLYHLMTDWRTYFGSDGAGLAATVRIWDGGLGIWGAVALGGVGAWIACRRRGIPLPAFGDAIAPGIILAQAIGRIGNYFNQELYGRATTLPWGLQIFDRKNADGQIGVSLVDGVSTGVLVKVVEPTFLYELLWNILVFGLLIYVDRRFKMGHGRLFALYVASYCVGRFGIELLRDDVATHIDGIRINSFTSTFVFLGAAVYIILAPKGREDPAVLARTWQGPEGTGLPEPAAEPAGEEPVAEEPVTEEPVAETTAAEEVAAEQVEPEVEEPVAEEPAAEELVDDEPVVEEPVDEEPAAEEPVAVQPVDEEPVAEEPVAEEPVDDEPVAVQPVDEEPVDDEPVAEELVDDERVDEEPVDDEPVTEQAVAEEPVAEEQAAPEVVADVLAVEQVEPEETPAEEPAVEEPVVEETAEDERAAEAPADEEPDAEATAVDEPAEETAAVEAPAEEPVAEETAAEEPVAEETAAAQVASEEPTADETIDDDTDPEDVTPEDVTPEDAASEDETAEAPVEQPGPRWRLRPVEPEAGQIDSGDPDTDTEGGEDAGETQVPRWRVRAEQRAKSATVPARATADSGKKPGRRWLGRRAR